MRTRNLTNVARPQADILRVLSAPIQPQYPQKGMHNGNRATA